MSKLEKIADTAKKLAKLYAGNNLNLDCPEGYALLDQLMLDVDMEMCSGLHCKETNAASPPHTCPYAEEINNDYDTLCNCCDQCQQECAWDI